MCLGISNGGVLIFKIMIWYLIVFKSICGCFLGFRGVGVGYICVII